MKKFKMTVEWMDPKVLKPYANNAKVHEDAQIDKLANSIAKFGFDQPIVVDKNNVIVKGHGRHSAALRLALKEVPVVIAKHLTEHEAMASRIADNKVSSLQYDMDKLHFELGTLDRVGIDLNLTGMEFDEIKEGLRFKDMPLRPPTLAKPTGPVVEIQAAPVRSVPKEELLAPDKKGPSPQKGDEVDNRGFLLTKDQIATLDEALALAKSLGDFSDEKKNPRPDSNALTLICDFFLSQND